MSKSGTVGRVRFRIMVRDDVYGDPGVASSGISDAVGSGGAVGPRGPFTGPSATNASVNSRGSGLGGAGAAAGVSEEHQFRESKEICRAEV